MTSKFSLFPARRFRLQRAAASFALLLSAGAARAEIGDNITLELTPTEGTFEDLDPIGIDACVDALGKMVKLSAIIADQDPNQDTRKSLFVSLNQKPECTVADDLDQAYNSAPVPVKGCTWIGGTTGYDKTAEPETKEVALRELLPNDGAGACSNAEQRRYYFFLMVAPDPTKHGKGWSHPGAKARRTAASRTAARATRE